MLGTSSQLLTTSTSVIITSQLRLLPSVTSNSQTTTPLLTASSTLEFKSFSVSKALESSVTKTTSHVVITRLMGDPPHSDSYSHTTNVHTPSTITMQISVTPTNPASPELNLNSVNTTSLSESMAMTTTAAVTNNLETYSTNNPAMQIATSTTIEFPHSRSPILASEKMPQLLTSITKSAWMIQPSVTPAIGAAMQEGKQHTLIHVGLFNTFIVTL